MNILVFVEQRANTLKKSSFEALTLATALAGGNTERVSACIVGEGCTSLAAQLKGYGVDTVYTADAPLFKNFNAVEFTGALAAAVKASAADLVIGIASPMAKEFFPRLSARLNCGLVTDVVDLKLDGSSVLATKPMYAGKALADLVLKAGSTKIVSIRPNSFPSKQSGQGKAEVKTLTVDASTNSRLVLKEIRKGATTKADLTEASFIISGGRSLGSADNFKILSACADVVGGSVGASRAAVDAGYASHDMQVGQTGKTVNPNVYVACGLSGSIQHMAGMRTSKIIVAINTDKEAPIFNIADYGIVADLFQAVPILTEKLKALT